MIFQFLQHAVKKVGTNPDAQVDFVDLVLHNLPLPDQQIVSCLVAFFEYVFSFNKEKYGVHHAFQLAFETLAARIYHAFRHHIIRMKGPDELKVHSIPESMMKLIADVESKIIHYQPCYATQWADGIEVTCESIKENHRPGIPHQSSRTQRFILPAKGVKGWFGFSREVVEAIRWPGGYKEESKYKGNLKNAVNEAIEKMKDQTIEQFKEQHQQFISDKTYTTPSYRACLGCILNLPTEQLKCGHLLCSKCCKELEPVDSFITCPFCKSKVMWNNPELPEGAGYRILSLDGGGIRGISTAMILSQIEEYLGLPISSLFDLVIGSGSGGLIALMCGEGKRKDEIVSFFHDLAEGAFVPASILGGAVAQLLLCYRYKRGPLNEVLGRHFSKNPLLGVSSTRVSMVGCVPFITPTILLHSSYHPANSSYRYKLNGTVRDVAEIFGSGILYPVCLFFFLSFFSFHLFSFLFCSLWFVLIIQ